jgi:hypothetical protein
MNRVFLAALFAALPIASVAATTLTPSTIVGTPATYDGQTVSVAGTVQKFKSRNTQMGQVGVFELCDAKCVHVIDKTNQSHTDGSSATISGTFHETFKTPKKTWNNVIIIGG